MTRGMTTMTAQIHRVLLFVAVLTCSVPALAQSRQVPAAPQRAPIVIHDVTVHPVDRPVIERGYVVFTDGVITDLGSGRAPRVNGAERVDGAGLHLYPGLIASETQLGLTEVGAVPVTQDYDEYGSNTPEVRAGVAVNPDSDLLPVARANGILTALTMPSGGTVTGRAALIRLDGWTWEDLAITLDAGLVVSWPRTDVVSSPWMRQSPAQQRERIAENLKTLETFFDDADAYFAAREHDETIAIDQRYEGMRATMRGDAPLFVRAASATQIESAVTTALRRGMRPVIVGGRDADRVAPLLVEHDVPVIISGTHRRPGDRHDAYDRPFTLPTALDDAGVRFAIASGAETPHERHLNHNAATAAAYGLDRDAALRAVTLSAAEILGVGDVLGSITEGKAGTLILTDGDPLEITTTVVAAWIDGRRIDLSSRHTMLYEKYQQKYEQARDDD